MSVRIKSPTLYPVMIFIGLACTYMYVHTCVYTSTHMQCIFDRAAMLLFPFLSYFLLTVQFFFTAFANTLPVPAGVFFPVFILGRCSICSIACCTRLHTYTLWGVPVLQYMGVTCVRCACTSDDVHMYCVHMYVTVLM